MREMSVMKGFDFKNSDDYDVRNDTKCLVGLFAIEFKSREFYGLSLFERSLVTASLTTESPHTGHSLVSCATRSNPLIYPAPGTCMWGAHHPTFFIGRQVWARDPMVVQEKKNEKIFGEGGEAKRLLKIERMSALFSPGISSLFITVLRDTSYLFM